MEFILDEIKIYFSMICYDNIDDYAFIACKTFFY
jgi:hypothetical protein